MLMFEPLKVGPITVRNRIIAPPRAALLGSIIGTKDEAERYISYWESIAAGATDMVVERNGFLENVLPADFFPDRQ